MRPDAIDVLLSGVQPASSRVLPTPPHGRVPHAPRLRPIAGAARRLLVPDREGWLSPTPVGGRGPGAESEPQGGEPSGLQVDRGSRSVCGGGRRGCGGLAARVRTSAARHRRRHYQPSPRHRHLRALPPPVPEERCAPGSGAEWQAQDRCNFGRPCLLGERGQDYTQRGQGRG